ncbi:hypothetical protein PIB30_012407 [Stylosanthes scabra]|uniref:Zinc finger GRF-type domain-containing protein n=1 Tax=Stylosanthes scabra TaxID=79078 RepID=A0ABU6R510_9FABA|nr:hypothetical protein [Stylosanthes scabra]
MATPQRQKSTSSQSCSSACVGSPSFVKNRKKKFEYNNGKCLHSLDAVMLEFGTQLNPGGFFLRCPLWERANLRCDYFIWVDEIGDGGKTMGSHKRIDESHQKTNCSNEDVMKLIHTISLMGEELKFIKKQIHCIFVGFGVLDLMLLMYLIMK